MPRFYPLTRAGFFKTLPVIVLIFAALLLMNFAFGDVLVHPASYVFGFGGDALKNYYTYLYHIKYGQGTHFKGMLYPFGDHIVYADGQPLLSVPLSYLKQIGIPLPDSGLAILNLLMLLALPVSSLILYRILRENLLPAWPAVIGALLISFMSPHFERILGHYGLSYTFIIPLYWYLLILAFKRTNSWLPLCGYIAAAFLAGLLHPYWISMAALFALTYGLVALVQHTKVSTYSKSLAIRVMLAGVVVVVIFQLFMATTDNVTDRPVTPIGFLGYRSSFGGVFYPVLEPLKGYWQNFFDTEEAAWEGWAYVGLIGLVTLILTGIRLMQYIIRRRLRAILRPVMPQPLRIGIFAGVLALLFACGVPFIWGLMWTLDYIKPLKQFRSIGRFSWLFYYVYTVYVVYYFYSLYRYMSMRNASRFAISFLTLVIVVWAWEDKNAFTTFVNRIPSTETKHDFLDSEQSIVSQMTWKNRYPSDFQAIIPLPFYLVGPEVIIHPSTGGAEYESMRASFQTGLPLLSASLSRTSISNALQNLQIFSNELIPKTVLQRFSNQKPLLLLVTNDPLSEAEKKIISKARFIASDAQTALYELPLTALDATPHRSAALRDMASYSARPDIVRHSWSSSVNNSPFGTHTLIGFNNTEIYSGVIPQAQDTTTYEASIWIRVAGMEGMPVMHIQEMDSQTGAEVNAQTIATWLETDIYNGWVRASGKMRLHNVSNKLEISLEGDKIEVADLLIKPAYIDVYDKLYSGKIFKNNFPLQD